MTREEAIEVLENGEWWEELAEWYMIVHPEHDKLHDAVDMAISAIRQQEHFREVTKKVEPLTLDELRKMDGEPVWVQSPGVPEYGRWAIVEGVGENCLFLRDDFTCHDYGKTWLAYRQKPEEDDHDERKENENA